MPISRFAFAVFFAALFVSAAPAEAQPFPKKGTIKIIVPQAVGSATDTVGRALATHIGAEIGQQIIVDNRPGAGGLLGSELAAKAAPDGYTLILANISTHGVNPGLYPKLPYDPIKDFAPIGLAGGTSNILIVNAALPIKTLKELIDAAKANPGKLCYASPGQGSLAASRGRAVPHARGRHQRDACAVSRQRSGRDRGDERRGVLHDAGDAVGAARHQERQGARDRGDEPQAPSGFSGPADDRRDLPGLRRDVVVRPFGAGRHAAADHRTMSAAMRKALANPEAIKALANAGMEPAFSSPEEFGAYIKAEIDKWTKVARAANVKLE